MYNSLYKEVTATDLVTYDISESQSFRWNKLSKKRKSIIVINFHDSLFHRKVRVVLSIICAVMV